MKINLVKVLYDSTVDCTINVPDDSVFMKVDYQHYCGFRGHDTYGLLIRCSQKLKKFNKITEPCIFKLEDYWYTLIYQCYLQDESLLTEIDTVFKDTYIKETYCDKHAINEYIKQFITTKDEEFKEPTVRYLQELKKLADGELLSFHKVNRFSHEGIKTIAINTGYCHSTRGVVEETITYNNFVNIITINDYNIGDFKQKFGDKNSANEFNKMYHDTLETFKTTYDV